MKIEKWTERRRILHVYHEQPLLNVSAGGVFSLGTLQLPKQIRVHGVIMMLKNCDNPYVELYLIAKDMQNNDQKIFSGRYLDTGTGDRNIYYQEQTQNTITGNLNQLVQSFFPRAIGQYSDFQIYVSPGTVQILESFDIYFSQF